MRLLPVKQEQLLCEVGAGVLLYTSDEQDLDALEEKGLARVEEATGMTVPTETGALVLGYIEQARVAHHFGPRPRRRA